MKIFFVASIHGKAEYSEKYKAIVNYVKELGHTIEAGHVLNVSKEILESWTDEQNIDYHKKILDGVKKADLVFSEMSYQSTSVGYLLSVAVESNTPVVLFYSGEQIPHILLTLESYDKFQIIHYRNVEDLKDEIPRAIEYASEQMDTRFNFFISPKIASYLDWIAKEKRLPRAVYLRNLIKDKMTADEEYQKA